ncbi:MULTISPECIES: CbiX/SirB N-terminal domain-containing protein [Azospirillum]|uniref:CbiX/SirB N-terminal domain-containing protein n=1 Tax=Azospirillum brasilense TaxID=192 RepID=A0ABU4PEB0_AZOBR|nr:MULTISPECIES: CbiX/SirB N-terminal domain-containing protein [Azospirillum]ALJ39445.1 hypothetical protein AMK58_28550 [Azospirillum brasilense]MDX5955935.1 CbiX/SirB N-terminal domain-containing protein [Azospirillum brasilense]PWC82938.1 hypothetical protein AEJ54_31335 [Azospirillum sp. Sp 7]
MSAGDTGLLLFAHGTLDGTGGAIAESVAAALRARGRFAEVAVSFSRQSPSLAEALATMRSPRVLVAPLLACQGRLMRQVLPSLLAEVGEDRRWTLLPPLGTLPGMVGIARDLVGFVLNEQGLAAQDITVLVAGHGSSVGTASRDATRSVAAGLARLACYGGVETVFLSEAPFAFHWPLATAAERVVVVPFFISGGHHEESDLPAMLRKGGASLDGTEAAGRRLWMTPAVGRHPAIPDLIEAEALVVLRASPV